MSLMEKVKESPLKAIGGVLSLILTIVGGVFLIEDRYAHAESVTAIESRVDEIEQSYDEKTDAILKYMQLQAQSRITILQMKEAQDLLTPEEKVELNILKEQLRTLEGH